VTPISRSYSKVIRCFLSLLSDRDWCAFHCAEMSLHSYLVELQSC